MENIMRLEFPAFSCNESFARAAVGAFFLQLNPTLEELADVKTAVSEAVTNSIVHGYQNGIGNIVIECRIEDNKFWVAVMDRGVGIEDVEQAKQPFFSTIGGEERSGMGFTVMETFMDCLEVTSTPGNGTKVTMSKSIHHTSNAEQGA